MEEEQKPEPKISLPEVIIVGGFILFIDVVNLVLLFLGIPSSTVTSILMFPATQLYMALKGVKGTYFLISNVLELIPWVGDLPLRTVGFAVVCYIDRHPEGKLETVAKIVDVAHKKGLPYSEMSRPSPEAVAAASGVAAAPVPSTRVGRLVQDVRTAEETLGEVLSEETEAPKKSEIVEEASAPPPRQKLEPSAGQGPASFADVLKLTGQPPEEAAAVT